MNPFFPFAPHRAEPPLTDRWILAFDQGLRTLFGKPVSSRPIPGDDFPDPELSPAETQHVAALMRVNHAGEVCAQALYQGQALTARRGMIRNTLKRAATEETDHLAWTQQRLEELGGQTSRLNPFWYLGSLLIGATAGALGDKWSLGFLGETEKQVVEHLAGHLERLPPADEKSKAMLLKMQEDEARHATSAMAEGGENLPYLVRLGMRLAARVMTSVAFRV